MSRIVPQRPRVLNQRASNTKQRRQQHLLDVKVRSHKAVAQRNRRIFVVTSKVTLSLLVLAAIVDRRALRSEAALL